MTRLDAAKDFQKSVNGRIWFKSDEQFKSARKYFTIKERVEAINRESGLPEEFER